PVVGTGHHGITGDGAITVINDAGGTIIGGAGSAVNIDNDSDPPNLVQVINHGDMEARSGDGDGVDADGMLKLDNWGEMQACNASGSVNAVGDVFEGVALGGGTINNYKGGTIYGYGRGIQVDDSNNGSAFSAATIYNEGVIQGDGLVNFAPGTDFGIV